VKPVADANAGTAATDVVMAIKIAATIVLIVFHLPVYFILVPPFTLHKAYLVQKPNRECSKSLPI
jgi:hypothetical protein